MKIPFEDIVQAELMAHNITLCKGGCSRGVNHPRGCAFPRWREVHLAASFSTRSTLFRFLHEVGHILDGDDSHGILVGRRYEQEARATAYALQSFRDYGISIPRKLAADWKGYTARKKRHGDNIAKGRIMP